MADLPWQQAPAMAPWSVPDGVEEPEPSPLDPYNPVELPDEEAFLAAMRGEEAAAADVAEYEPPQQAPAYEFDLVDGYEQPTVPGLESPVSDLLGTTGDIAGDGGVPQFATEYDIEADTAVEMPGEFDASVTPFDPDNVSQEEIEAGLATLPEDMPAEEAAGMLTDPALAVQVHNQEQADADTKQQMAEKIEADAHAEALERVGEEKVRLAQTNAKMEKLQQAWSEQAEIDPDRYWNNLGTGRKIAAYIAAGIQGWLNPGGRNQTLELINDAIERDIAAQRADIDNGRAAMTGEYNALLELDKIAGNKAQAEDALALAGKKRLLAGLDAHIAQVDPNGTQAYRAEILKRKTLAEIEQRKAHMHEQELKASRAEAEERRKRDKAEREERESLEAEKHKKHADRIAAGNLALQNRKEKARQAERKEDIALKAAEREDKKREEAKKYGDPTKDEVLREMGKRGWPASERGKVAKVRDANGRLFVVLGNTPEQAGKMTRKFKSMINSARIIDQIYTLRDKVGASSGTINSDDYQKMRALRGKLVMNMKDSNELGAITKADEGLIDGVIGPDPTDWKNMMTHIDKAKELMEDEMRSDLQQEGAGTSFRFVKYSGVSKKGATTAADVRKSAKHVADEMDLGTWTIDQAMRNLDAEAEKYEIGSSKSLPHQHFGDEVPKALRANIDKYQAEIDKLTAKEYRASDEEVERIVDLREKIEETKKVIRHSEMLSRQKRWK